MKAWETPKLITLVRNSPQEAVLTLCKGSGEALVAAFVNPGTTYTGCTRLPELANPICQDCSTTAAS